MTDDSADLIFITRAIRQRLRAELARTGVMPHTFLKQRNCLNPEEIPTGFDAKTLKSLFRGRKPEVPAAHVEFILGKLAEIGDGEGKFDRNGKPFLRRGRNGPLPGEQWIEVTAEMVAHIKNERERTGFDIETLLAAADVPQGLTLRVMQSWLYRQAKTVDPRYWSFVITRLAEMPDRVRWQ